MDNSIATINWFSKVIDQGDRLFGSRMLEVEVARQVRNRESDPEVAGRFLINFSISRLDDELAFEAIAIKPKCGGADAMHLAAALRLGTEEVTVVTHDAQMARAAAALGFAVIDPVSDDPNKGPVAPQM